MTTLTQTVTTMPLRDDRAEDTFIKILIDSNRKIYQQMYLYVYEGYEGLPHYQIACYGRNNSFLVHAFDNYPDALAEFNRIVKDGE